MTLVSSSELTLFCCLTIFLYHLSVLYSRHQQYRSLTWLRWQNNRCTSLNTINRAISFQEAKGACAAC